MTNELRPPILIKRYGRSRLYHGAARRYVTVADLKKWAASAIPFVVIDTERGDDVTRVLLD